VAYVPVASGPVRASCRRGRTSRLNSGVAIMVAAEVEASTRRAAAGPPRSRAAYGVATACGMVERRRPAEQHQGGSSSGPRTACFLPEMARTKGWAFRRYGVMTMAKGPVPTVIGVSAVLVAVWIGVIKFDSWLAT
jgi:hypothetical protein